MSPCFKKWEGINIETLPYFDKLLSLYSKMSEGWVLYTSLDVNGMNIITSKGMKVDKTDNIISISDFLHYIECSRIITKVIHKKVSYTSNVTYTAKEHQNIMEISETIKGNRSYSIENTIKNASCVLIIDNDRTNIEMLAETKEASSIQMVQEVGEKIRLFGIEVELPSLQINLDDVLPKIHGEVNQLNPGDTVKIEWIPQEGFKWSISYQS